MLNMNVKHNSSVYIALILISLLIATSEVENTETTKTIVHGLATANVYPYMAAIIHAPTNKVICRGVVTGETHIITAAQCLAKYRKRIKEVKLLTGLTYLKKNKYIRRKITKIIIHKKFKNPKYKDTHNIAIAEVQEPFNFTRKELPVKPINLAKTTVDVGKDCIFTGYTHPKRLPKIFRKTMLHQKKNKRRKSSTAEVKSRRSKLMSTILKITDSNICNKVQDISFEEQNIICSITSEAEQKLCNNDSGSPLVCDGELQGIAFFHFYRKCGNNSLAPVNFTSVTAHIDWLMEHNATV